MLTNQNLVFNKFQFTPLREGRLVWDQFTAMAGYVFQFTPLREGRLMITFTLLSIMWISIHAPA